MQQISYIFRTFTYFIKSIKCLLLHIVNQLLIKMELTVNVGLHLRTTDQDSILKIKKHSLNRSTTYIV